MSERAGKRVQRVHARELTTETVALGRTGDGLARQVARELRLADSLVRARMPQTGVNAEEGSVGALTTAEKAELSQLRRGGEGPPNGARDFKQGGAFFGKENA